MTCKPNPPVMTHQPGSPADSASCEKPGSSPKPLSSNPRSLKGWPEGLVQCNVNDGIYPKIGDLVWVWFLFTEKWQVYTVLDQRQHKFGGPEYNILNTELGSARWMRYNKLYMPRQ